jgi:ribosome-associated translation inhibitor RaiA
MQVILNADPHIEAGAAMAAHLKTVLNDALGRFGEQITRVEVHLADTNGHAKTHPEEILCTLEARMVGRDPIVVKEHAGSAHQAISGATGKLKRAVATALDKHDPRRSAGAPTPEPAEDA